MKKVIEWTVLTFGIIGFIVLLGVFESVFGRLWEWLFEGKKSKEQREKDNLLTYLKPKAIFWFFVAYQAPILVSMLIFGLAEPSLTISAIIASFVIGVFFILAYTNGQFLNLITKEGADQQKALRLLRFPALLWAILPPLFLVCFRLLKR